MVVDEKVCKEADREANKVATDQPESMLALMVIEGLANVYQQHFQYYIHHHHYHHLSRWPALAGGGGESKRCDCNFCTMQNSQAILWLVARLWK